MCRLCYFLSVLVIISCSPIREERHSFRITEESGVVIAETRGGPKYSDPIFSIEEVVRIREEESEEGSLLIRPQWMGLDEDEMIYVFDGFSAFNETRLVVYNQNGSYSHVIGRKGRGPGEYLDPQLISINKGTVTLFERSLRRISRFSRDGSFIRLFTCAPSEAPPDKVYLDSDENRVIIYATRTGNWNSQKAVVYSPEGKLLGTVETPRVRRYDGMETSRAKVQTPPHFNGQALINYSTIHGILTTDGNEAVVNWYDFSGELVKVYDLGLKSGPVTEEDRALADSYFRNLWLDGGPVGEELYRSWVKEDKFPQSRAFWNGATIDKFGYLWLDDPSSHFHATERHYRVVNPDGEYLGDCYLPQGNVRITRGHYLLINENIRTGERNLIVYRIIPTVNGLEYP